MPSVNNDEWDYEDALFRRYGMVLSQIVTFAYSVAIDITASSRIESEELVNDFVANKLLKGPFPSDRVDNPRGYLRRSLANHHIDMLRKQARLPLPIPQLVEDRREAAAIESEVDDFVERAWFWAIVDDPRFPPKYARAIHLRLDRETFASLGDWDEIAARWDVNSSEKGLDRAGSPCSRHAAKRRFDRGMQIVRRVLEDADWTDHGEQEEQ